MPSQIAAQTATTVQTHSAILKHRCKADIFAVILETAASGEVQKSKIYYNSFLTYKRLKRYMSLLIDAGLIQHLDYKDNRVYRTTEKGMLFLQAYKSMKELID
jgi:predicted transcriptional regulator